jgi:hypothetical protein
MSDSLDEARAAFSAALREYTKSLERLAEVVKARVQRHREFNERMEARLAEIDAKSADTTKHGQHSD